jgi:hypothetical protein
VGSSKLISTTLLGEELPDNEALRSKTGAAFGFMAAVDMAMAFGRGVPLIS